MTDKKRKPKTQAVLMIKVGNYQGIDTYAPADGQGESILNGRHSFEAAIPVMGRSLNMNALWAVFYVQIGKETGQTPAEVKAECKLNYGVPIMCASSEEFRRVWAAKFAGDTYEQQLFMMKYLPVTSLFSKFQGVDYTDTLIREYAKQQIQLIVL